MVAGLQAGITTFDTSLGGLGGCPFIPGAAGNIATEDAVYALQEMGVETGIDWRKLADLAMQTRGTAGTPPARAPGPSSPGRLAGYRLYPIEWLMSSSTIRKSGKASWPGAEA